MGRWLGLGIDRNISPTMTDRTLPGHSSVINYCRRKRDKSICMTGIALTGSGDVRNRLGQRIGKQVSAVVAGNALPRSASVIHHRWGKGNEVVVAGIALH